MIMKPILTRTVGACVLLLTGFACQSNSDTEISLELADFAITVQATEDGVHLTCSKGCAWDELSWNPSNVVQGVDEYGMSND